MCQQRCLLEWPGFGWTSIGARIFLVVAATLPVGVAWFWLDRHWSVQFLLGVAAPISNVTAQTMCWSNSWSKWRLAPTSSNAKPCTPTSFAPVIYACVGKEQCNCKPTCTCAPYYIRKSQLKPVHICEQPSRVVAKCHVTNE